MTEDENLDRSSAPRYNPDTIRIDDPVSFDWDEGNRDKNLASHDVTDREAEEAFFDPNRRLYPDPKHSQGETRRIIVGKTKEGRLLFVVFAVRRKKIRVISARDLNEIKRD
ncbi:MAG: BrnT family toxin [Chloroflexota bacterium]|nr:BrnT family toxin [Chloroflexota bacterium]